MAYDTATGTVVLFGGSNSTNPYLSDTWTYDGTTWAQQFPATVPPVRSFSTMAYDTATGTIVLFGGYNASGYLSDTWTYNGTTWTQQSPATSPSARSASAMAYDATTGTAVLFGGYTGVNVSDTWTYNGTTWMQQSPATSPSARADPTMSYDVATGSVLLFGGYTGTNAGDTWTYDGTTWTQQSPAVSPPARFRSTTAYDAATATVVLFGGNNGSASFGDTYTYASGYIAASTGPVATAAAQTAVSFFIGTSGTLPALSNNNVLTTGISGLDFTLGTGSTCTGTVTAGQTCTVDVAFTPRFPGFRTGAVRLLNSGGTVIATAYIIGIGTGPLAVTYPGTQTQLSAVTGSNIFEMTTDAAGNLYVGDFNNNNIKKYSVAGSTATLLSTLTLGQHVAQMTVDGAGNVFAPSPPPQPPAALRLR